MPLRYIINIYAVPALHDRLVTLMNKVRNPTCAITRTYIHKTTSAKGTPRYEAKIVVPATQEERVCTRKSAKEAISCAKKKSRIQY